MQRTVMLKRKERIEEGVKEKVFINEEAKQFDEEDAETCKMK